MIFPDERFVDVIILLGRNVSGAIVQGVQNPV